MPEAPIIGFNTLGKWFFDLLFAILTIPLALNLYRAANALMSALGIQVKFLGMQLGGSHGEGGGDVPIREIMRPAIRAGLSMILMIAAIRVPPLIIADAASIDSLWTVLWDTGKAVIGVGGGSPEG